jgi:tetratricopeptide (TPR) repeat protein
MLRTWLFRILRATFMAVVAWILYQVLDHYDHEWLFVPIVGGLLLLWAAEQARRIWVRRKREADWDRWERAVLVAEDRPRAIAEVRQALERSRRFGTRLRQEQAHLSVLLADLLDASGRAEEAVRVLAKVDLDALKPSQAVVVRHAKVVAYLSANLLDDAEAVLATRSKESGAPDMDARLDLLAGALAVERGRPEEALAIAEQVERRFPADPALQAEVRVLRAVATDARGERDQALALLRTLDVSTLEHLEVLGPRRVRPLAADTRKEYAGATRA